MEASKLDLSKEDVNHHTELVKAEAESSSNSSTSSDEEAKRLRRRSRRQQGRKHLLPERRKGEGKEEDSCWENQKGRCLPTFCGSTLRAEIRSRSTPVFIIFMFKFLAS